MESSGRLASLKSSSRASARGRRSAHTTPPVPRTVHGTLCAAAVGVAPSHSLLRGTAINVDQKASANLLALQLTERAASFAMSRIPPPVSSNDAAAADVVRCVCVRGSGVRLAMRGERRRRDSLLWPRVVFTAPRTLFLRATGRARLTGRPPPALAAARQAGRRILRAQRARRGAAGGQPREM
jgi:hypothetical protein